MSTENFEKLANVDKTALYAARFKEIIALEKIDPRLGRPCISCAATFRPTLKRDGCIWAFCSESCETTWLAEALKDCSGRWIQEHIAVAIDRHLARAAPLDRLHRYVSRATFLGAH